MWFSDFSSAFNTTISEQLIHKLDHLELDFLTGRPQAIHISKNYSRTITLNTGSLKVVCRGHSCSLCWPMTQDSSNLFITFPDSNRVERTAEKVIKDSLPSIEDIYSTRLSCKPIRISFDPTHPSYCYFRMLPSRRDWEGPGPGAALSTRLSECWTLFPLCPLLERTSFRFILWMDS